MLQVWTPNTIPLPNLRPPPTEPPTTVLVPSSMDAPLQSNAIPSSVPKEVLDISDNFSKGIVVKYFVHQEYGFMKGMNGKELYFNLNELDFSGAKGKDLLKVGAFVGYDVACTSHGLHVKKLKIY